MTQGQMAPTTLIGQKTTTTPSGRTVEANGLPLQICELMSSLPGVAYLARETLIDPKTIRAAGRSIKRALQSQVEGRGFALVELVSTCPTWWYKEPLAAMQWLREEMLPQYPLKVFRDWTEESR